MQETIVTQSGDEKIFVLKSEYEQLKQGVQQVMLAWLDEQATHEKLQRCADFAISVLHNDLTLRVPRSPDQRKNGFAAWRNAWHDRLGAAIQEEFHRQFPRITSRLAPAVISPVLTDTDRKHETVFYSN